MYPSSDWNRQKIYSMSSTIVDNVFIVNQVNQNQIITKSQKSERTCEFTFLYSFLEFPSISKISENLKKIQTIMNKIIVEFSRFQHNFPSAQVNQTSFIMMFYQIFLSPQVKRWAIIPYKHDIYELPHEFPNDLRKLGNIRKVSKPHRIIAQPPLPPPK